MKKSIIKNKKRKQSILILFSLFLLIFSIIGIFHIKSSYGSSKVVIKHVDRRADVISYDAEVNKVVINVTAGEDEVSCAVSSVEDMDNLNFMELKDKKCSIIISLDKKYVYFLDKNGVISEPYIIDSMVVNADMKDKYYIPIGNSLDFSEAFTTLGEMEIVMESESSAVSIEGLKLTGVENEDAYIVFSSNGEIVKSINVVVTNTITQMPTEFDTKKPYLPCNQFSKEEADLLDEILAERVKEAGEGTRAGAVAAARFLTLEFPYRMTYFFENGRISGTSPNWADGEGRYYHKGLYLHEDKKSEMQNTMAGPSIWGCPLTNYEPDEPYFVWGVKYPNGLDCSGFVSWALLNGGFDPGDIGAGESWYPNQLTDLGEFTSLTDSLIDSGKIKVGDLFNTWGHIAILVGIDDQNFYIAESLDIYKGVVVKKYKKHQVFDYFQYVVFMDGYYKEDGNLTDLWY